MLLCSILPISQKFNSCVTDGLMDGQTDGQTDGRMDTPFYRDARTHLKRNSKKKKKSDRVQTTDGDLPAHLSQNRLFDGIVSCSG